MGIPGGYQAQYRFLSCVIQKKSKSKTCSFFELIMVGVTWYCLASS